MTSGTDAPLTFITDDDLADMTPGTLVVDVSCDEAMGFSWALPTTFTTPVFEVGDGVLYYAVDHSPSYLWDSATWENSEALLPFLHPVLGGRGAWDADPTIRRAIEIRDGVIQNRAILSPGPCTGVPALAYGGPRLLKRRSTAQGRTGPPFRCPDDTTRGTDRHARVAWAATSGRSLAEGPAWEGTFGPSARAERGIECLGEVRCAHKVRGSQQG
jgi:Alanine dehydrogenase/PNT, C-terminal domain